MKCVAVHDYTRTFLEERTRPKRLVLAIDYIWSPAYRRVCPKNGYFVFYCTEYSLSALHEWQKFALAAGYRLRN